MRRTSLLFALSLAMALLAIDSTSSAEEEIWKAVFGGTSNVDVVNVEVVVTSKDGQPVTGLTADDFEIFENGKQVDISNFYSVRDGLTLPFDSSAGSLGLETSSATIDELESPADPPLVPRTDPQPHHIVIFIDNVNLRSANRNHAVGDLRKFLLGQAQLGARVMVMTNDRSLVIRQEFTSVPHDIMVALAEVEQTAAASPRFDQDRSNVIRAIEAVNVEAGSGLFATKAYAGQSLDPTADSNQEQNALTTNTEADARAALAQLEAYASQRLQHTRDSFRVLDHLIDTVAGLPGRRTVLYISDGLSLKPGEALLEAYTRRFAALRDVGARTHADARAARDDATPELRALLDHANASDITFYSLDASPAERLSYGSAESTGYDGGNFAAWNDSLSSMEEHNDQQGIRLLAQNTGGLFAPSRSSFDFLINGLMSASSNYYSLGFAALRDPERETRRLEVRVARERGYVVRHRSSFRDVSFAERSAERARGALLLDDTDNTFDISISTADPLPLDDGTYEVPVSVSIPLGKLVLLPGESTHEGKVSMFVAVRDQKGRTSEVNQHICPIRIPTSEVQNALGHRAGCGMRLKMRSGRQRIAVSVLDELSAIDSTAFITVEIGGRESAAGQI